MFTTFLKNSAFITLFISSVVFSMMPSLATASGFAGPGAGTAPSQSAKKRVDKNYEAGKAIFKGRVKQYQPHTFCISNNDNTEKVAIKRATIKRFKKQSANDLYQSVYSCHDTNTLAKDILAKQDMLLLLYYLNKRYSLKLT